MHMRYGFGVAVGMGLVAIFAAPGPVLSRERRAAPRDAVVRDWMLQDYMSVDLPLSLIHI